MTWLLHLMEKSDGEWKPRAGGGSHPDRESAEAEGEQWVAEDRENRHYEVMEGPAQ